jgi:single-strand DNA-binding protein
MNKITLIGRLTHDPELRYTPNGDAVANFSIAVDRKMSKQDITDFIPVVTWRKLAEICNQYLSKGKLVAVEGRLQTRSYEKDGVKQRAFDVVADEVVFLEKADGNGGNGNGNGHRDDRDDRDERPRQQQQRSRDDHDDRPRQQSSGGQRSQGGGQQQSRGGTQTRQRDDSHGGGFPPNDSDLGIDSDDIPF